MPAYAAGYAADQDDSGGGQDDAPAGRGRGFPLGSGPGENVLMAYDIYNGLKLWEREIRGAMRANASHDGSVHHGHSHGSRSLFHDLLDRATLLRFGA